MIRKRRIAVWARAVLSVIVVAVGLFFIIRQRQPEAPILLTGVVLKQDADPQKQSPIPDAVITATTGQASVSAVSDSSGLFHLTLHPHTARAAIIELNFRHPEYLSLGMTATDKDQLYIARLSPVPSLSNVPVSRSESRLGNVRVRYSEKAAFTSNIGPLVKTFEVVNRGNVPCGGRPPCSPDDKWKASIGSFTVEAEGHEFRNVRLSCIAGPCPFSRVESEAVSPTSHNLQISVRNWSDTTTYLLEAEVSQTILSEVIRQSYPAIFGSSMNFTLPATAEGPSIEAEVSGPGDSHKQDIVFPLGPDLILSWASCSAKITPEHTKLFRCDLKPGYRFQ